MTGRIDKFWVVRDPSPISVLVDIFFEATPKSIGRYVIGGGLPSWEQENHTFYADRGSALRDAQARLKNVQKQASALELAWGKRAGR